MLIRFIVIALSVFCLIGCSSNNNNGPFKYSEYQKPALKILKLTDKSKDKKMYQLAETNVKLAQEKSTIKKALLLMKLKKLSSSAQKN